MRLRPPSGRGVAGPAAAAPPFDLLADWTARTVRSEAGKEGATLAAGEQRRLVDAAVARYRPEVAAKRDPFAALAAGDPAARARETVLWEDADVMAVTAKHDVASKVLVVPKALLAFPCDASPRQLAALTRLAGAVSDAFQEVAKSGPARVAISPPDDLELARLHVHVHPPGLVWRGSHAAFWRAMAAAVRRRLG